MKKIHKPIITLAEEGPNRVALDLEPVYLIPLFATSVDLALLPFDLDTFLIDMDISELLAEIWRESISVYILFDKREPLEGRDVRVEEILRFINLYFKVFDCYTHDTPEDKQKVGEKLIGLSRVEVKLKSEDRPINLRIFKRMTSILLTEGYNLFLNINVVTFETRIFVTKEENEIVYVMDISISDVGKALREEFTILSDHELVTEPKDEGLKHLNIQIIREIIKTLTNDHFGN